MAESRTNQRETIEEYIDRVTAPPECWIHGYGLWAPSAEGVTVFEGFANRPDLTAVLDDAVAYLGGKSV